MSNTHPPQILGVYRTPHGPRALTLTGDPGAGYQLLDTIHAPAGDERDPRPVELERLPAAEAQAIARDYLALARAAQHPLVNSR